MSHHDMLNKRTGMIIYKVTESEGHSHWVIDTSTSHISCTTVAGHEKGLQRLGNHPWNCNFLFLLCFSAYVRPSHALNVILFKIPIYNQETDTHLYDLCVRSETVKQEADDSHVPTVKHQLLWSKLERGVWSHQLGSVWANCNTEGKVIVIKH